MRNAFIIFNNSQRHENKQHYQKIGVSENHIPNRSEFLMVTMLMTGRVITLHEECETMDQHIERHEKAVKEALKL